MMAQPWYHFFLSPISLGVVGVVVFVIVALVVVTAGKGDDK